MIMKRVKSIWAVVVLVALGFTSCNSWLDMEGEDDNQLSYLTSDVDFVAESVIAKHYPNSNMNGREYEKFFFEFVGADRSGKKDVMVLDLLAPDGTEIPTGVYEVGYTGDYVALSRYDVPDSTGVYYSCGSYYGEAENNFLTDYYGFLTAGKVTILQPEAGTYQVEVDAKSLFTTVKMTYTGAIKIEEISDADD